MLQLICGFALLIANLVLIRRTRQLGSPFSIISVTFFVPLIVATLSLSNLQHGIWAYRTNVLVAVSVLVWGLVPFLLLLIVSGKSGHGKSLRTQIEELPYSFVIFARLFAVTFLVCFFAENYILTKHLLPYNAGGSTMHEIHAKSLPVIGLLTKGNSSVLLLLFVCAVRTRSPLDWIAIAVILIVPAMRGSRIDIFQSAIALGVAFSMVSNMKPFRLLAVLLVGAMVLTIAGGALAYYRTSQGNRYQISLADIAGLSLKDSDLFTPALSQLFSNFVVPFEDLDHLVRKNPRPVFWGELTLISPLPNAFFEFHHLVGLENVSAVESEGYGDPVATNGVNTALAAFYLDFGAVGAAFPMLLYLLFWLYLFFRRNGNVGTFLVYCLMCSFFSLSAFQAYMADGRSFRLMILVLIPFIFIERRQRRQLRQYHAQLDFGRTHDSVESPS